MPGPLERDSPEGGHGCEWDRDARYVLEALNTSKENEGKLFEKVEELRVQVGMLQVKVAYIAAAAGAGIAGIVEGLKALAGH